jgi:hypothetical protein
MVVKRKIISVDWKSFVKIWKMVYEIIFRKPFSKNARLTPPPFLLYLSHNTVKYFPEHFPECNQTQKKKKFIFPEIILQWKIFYIETNGALTELTSPSN